MRDQRPVLAERYVLHLPIDRGDATPRFVGTSIATGQSVIVAVVSRPWAKLEEKAVAVAHRHLATLIEAIEYPDVTSFPGGFELPVAGTALVAELVRGVSLTDLLHDGPILPDRAVAWTIRVLEGLSVLSRRGGCHGAISAAAIVAEPKRRPIAPVVSRLVIPPLRDYASFERLQGAGPSAADDLWAVGVLLFEMLSGRRPFLPHAVANATSRFEAEDFAFLRSVPQGSSLETLLRHTIGERGSRFSSAEELLEALDCWERRVALPVRLPVKPLRPDSITKVGAPATWDPLVDEFSCGTKRLDAILDAAEQMRQSVQLERVSDYAPGPHHAGRPEFPRVTANKPGDSRSLKSSSPKSPRRPSSIGPELAAFAVRARPKLKPWIIGIGILGITAVVVANLWPYLEPRFNSEPAIAPSLQGVLDVPSVPSPSSSSVTRPKLSAREETAQCIASYFREGAVRKDVELGFVCAEEDFLSVTRRLHEESMNQIEVEASSVSSATSVPQAAQSANAIAPTISSAKVRTASANEALVVRSGTTTLGWQLGWYDLVATAIIRQNCCREAAPIKLPETTGWCQQLQRVVRRIASDSAKVGDISPGVRSFDEAVDCLVAQGKHSVYPHKTIPTSFQKSAFQQFLKRAAEVDAQRSSRR